jgi:DNA polymerase III alpha subunit
MQYGANVFMMGLAKKYKVPILVSDDAHMAVAKHKIVQDVRLSQNGDWRFYGTYNRKTSQEAFDHFKTHHNTTETEFCSWVENSRSWLDGFKGFVFKSNAQLPDQFFPKDSLAYTKQLIQKHGRMPKNNPQYVERLKKELDVLHRNGKIDLLKYLWIDEEICRQYQNQGILVSLGRGSAAGCLTAYLLGITHIDPIKYDLPFERFLTLDRIMSGKLPDIDQDLPNRDFLVGYETDVIEFEASDGTKHIVPKGFKLETQAGLVTVQEAIDRHLEFDTWWHNADQ